MAGIGEALGLPGLLPSPLREWGSLGRFGSCHFAHKRADVFGEDCRAACFKRNVVALPVVITAFINLGDEERNDCVPGGVPRIALALLMRDVEQTILNRVVFRGRDMGGICPVCLIPRAVVGGRPDWAVSPDVDVSENQVRTLPPLDALFYVVTQSDLSNAAKGTLGDGSLRARHFLDRAIGVLPLV